MANLPVDMGTTDGSPHSTPADHLQHHIALHKAFNATVYGPFTISYNTAGLYTGIELFTPAVGDRIIGVSVELLSGWISDDADQMGLGIAGTTDADLAFKFDLPSMVPAVKATFPRGQGIGIPFGGEVARILTEDPIVARAIDAGDNYTAGSLNLTVFTLSGALF